MKTRVIVSFIIAAITFPAIYFGGLFLDFLIGIIIFFASNEIAGVVSPRDSKLLTLLIIISLISTFFIWEYPIVILTPFVVMLAFFGRDFKVGDFVVCLVLIYIIAMAIFGVKGLMNISHLLTLMVVISNFATDVFAFFVGSTIGKHKLLPKVSPKKTVEGAIGGVVGSFIVTLIIRYYFFDFLDWGFVIVVGLLIPIFAQIGDLIFSYVKRKYNVKDYSSLLPGHGGVLDRLDSLLVVLALMNIILLVVN